MTSDPPAVPAPPFARNMRLVGVLLLTLSAVTPASSVFVIAPGIISQAGTGALISLIAAAFVAVAMALVYAELASAFPHAGGEYAMLARTLGPAVGFIYMGMAVVGTTLGPAVLALGAGDYLAAVWPGLPRLPVAFSVIAISVALGLLNIRVNAWVTGAFLIIELAALVVLGLLGFLHIQRPIGELLTHPVIAQAGHFTSTPVALMGLATAVAIFSYNGFGAAVYFSEEMQEAPRLVGRTIMLAMILTIAFEFIPVLAVLLGAGDIGKLLASQTPFTDFMLERGGPVLSAAISLGIALAILNAVIAVVLTNARFLFASGRDGAWQAWFNGALTQVHSRYKSPWVATLVAGATAAAACLIPFHMLLVMTGTGVVVTYILLCAGSMAGRITGSTASAPFRMPLFPLAPVLGLAALGYVIYANWLDLDVGRPSLIFSLALFALATAYFVLVRRGRGVAGALPQAEAAAD